MNLVQAQNKATTEFCELVMAVDPNPEPTLTCRLALVALPPHYASLGGVTLAGLGASVTSAASFVTHLRDSWISLPLYLSKARRLSFTFHKDRSWQSKTFVRHALTMCSAGIF